MNKFSPKINDKNNGNQKIGGGGRKKVVRSKTFIWRDLSNLHH